MIGFECLLIGFIVVGFRRSRVFTKAFLEENFGRFHYEQLQAAGYSESNSTGPTKGGYPDCGSGVYSEKLSYKDWHTFNVAIRTHMNFLEVLVPIITMCLIGGIQRPMFTFWWGLVFAFARFLYTIGYIYNVTFRAPGMLLQTIALFCLIYASCDSIWSMH